MVLPMRKSCFALGLLLSLWMCFSAGAGERGALEGLTPAGEMDFAYADQVKITFYEEGYSLIEVKDDASYLLVPEGEEIPEGVSLTDPSFASSGDSSASSLVVLPCPAKKIYLAGTSAMALFHAMDGMDAIGFSSLTAENWYVPEAREAMEKGDILFAGKYSEPDYELLLSQGCDLAVESTMIYHTPKVKEMLERLGIPVFVDRSSYEEHPLGRSEWVKVYGVLAGRREEAEAFFETQSQVVEEAAGYEKTDKRVAFFSVNTMGLVVVRANSDYVPKMLELAGAEYALKDIDLLEESKKSTINMSMEEFYASAVDADILVYNASIEAPLRSVEELIDKNSLFADFRAVKEGRVYCTDKYLYQATDILGTLIRDFHHMVTGEGEEEMVFLTHLE